MTWNWMITADGLEHLRCDLLADFDHGFFTRAAAPRRPEQLTEAIAPHASTHRLKQVHGNLVLRAGEAGVEEPYAEADGLASHDPGQAVWVCSADCTPALIADLSTGQVAAVHAGWRGTAARILPEAIATLQAQGSQLANLRVALGPAVTGPVYQVETAVALETARSIAPELDDEQLLTHLSLLPDSPVTADVDPGRQRLDVRRVNELQLLGLGLAPQQIAIAPHCTLSEPERFFSWRRDGVKAVQWSGIVSA